MESVNVLVTTSIGDECLQQITSVSPNIKLTDVSELFRAEKSGQPDILCYLEKSWGQ